VSSTSTSVAIAVSLSISGVLLILGTAGLLAGIPFGVDPVWAVEPVTLPEAAALHDNGEVVRLIMRGDDPNRAGTVRANFVRTEPAVLTPLEAAVAIRRADMVQVLLDNGASLDAGTWTRLFCFATVVDAGEVRALLNDRRPERASESCEHVQTPW
jgi:hypothetical protein